MDPYIERPAIWPDFHDSLIAAIRGLLQPLRRPRYAALTQDRLYVVEADRPIRPDVSVVRTSSRQTGGANLVEIDLLRAGPPTVRVSEDQLDSLRPWRYLVAVTRRWPSRHEVYAVPLERRLPRVAIPLADDDPDVPLDLQAAFTRCWDEGPYPELLHYEGPPPGELTDAESQWCRQRLEEAGFAA